MVEGNKINFDTGPLLDARGNPLSVRQGDYIRRFNELSRVMANMPDLYEAGKSASPEVLESLQKDFQESWIISSSRIHYEKDSLEAVITHYFNSTVVSPNEIKVLAPDYSNGSTLDKILNTEEGLKYLQALFNTNDDAETIKKTLEKLSNQKSKNIRVWTPDQNNRKKYQDRPAGFIYDGDGLFHVAGGDDGIDYNGRSRGVLDNKDLKVIDGRECYLKKDHLWYQGGWWTLICGVEYYYDECLKSFYRIDATIKLEID